jgi:hypothetical protein
MNAYDVLKYGHLTVLRTIDGLPGSEWETPGVCGVWSTKDIIAHLASYECVLIEVLSGFVDPVATPYLDRYINESEQFNDAEVEKRKSRSPSEALAEYQAAQAQTMSLIARIPPETLREPGTLPWYGMEYALDDYLTYAYYGHKREHCAQIAVFRDHLSHRPAEKVAE